MCGSAYRRSGTPVANSGVRHPGTGRVLRQSTCGGSPGSSVTQTTHQRSMWAPSGATRAGGCRTKTPTTAEAVSNRTSAAPKRRSGWHAVLTRPTVVIRLRANSTLTQRGCALLGSCVVPHSNANSFVARKISSSNVYRAVATWRDVGGSVLRCVVAGCRGVSEAWLSAHAGDCAHTYS